MPDVWELLGYAGIAVSAYAYLPQISHLMREHCSAGISLRAWSLWVVAGILIGAQAVKSGNPVFIALQATSLSASLAILALGSRYRGQVCATHARHVPSA
jgi:lipid-A-disaccharide synthase-like uncharacterized protein